MDFHEDVERFREGCDAFRISRDGTKGAVRGQPDNALFGRVAAQFEDTRCTVGRLRIEGVKSGIAHRPDFYSRKHMPKHFLLVRAKAEDEVVEVVPVRQVPCGFAQSIAQAGVSFSPTQHAGHCIGSFPGSHLHVYGHQDVERGAIGGHIVHMPHCTTFLNGQFPDAHGFRTTRGGTIHHSRPGRQRPQDAAEMVDDFRKVGGESDIQIGHNAGKVRTSEKK